jgi:hypothetical protein
MLNITIMKKNITLKIVSFLSIILFTVGITSAQSTGYMFPTDTALPHGWTNPLFGMDSDGDWSTVTHGAGCNCPWLYLSWNKGVTYTGSKLVGPFDTSDSWELGSQDTSLWGHSWVDTELSNTNFRLKIQNPGLSVSQGYQDFNFTIPSGAIIHGIRVDVLAHGNSGFTIFYLNAFKVDVFYTVATGVSSKITYSDNIELYPNPVHNNLTINVTGLSQLKYSLFSIDGKMVLDRNEGSIGNDFTTNISIEGISPGIYILRLENNFGTEYRKVVVQ